jgi:glycosyltransferase involved in cell wall biosynthesis
MNNKPRVSVVIPFWNAERFLAEAVESVFAQTFKAWELLLVDDGSNDTGSLIARRYSLGRPDSVKYLEHQDHRNRGQVVSRNLGMECAGGDCIALLDSDDVWLPHKLEQQVAVLDSQPTAALVYGASLYWHSWAGGSSNLQNDFVQGSRIPANRI